MAAIAGDGLLKVRKESTGRPPMADNLKKVYVGLTIDPKHKAWLESFDKGKSVKAREVFDKAMEAENTIV